MQVAMLSRAALSFVPLIAPLALCACDAGDALPASSTVNAGAGAVTQAGAGAAAPGAFAGGGGMTQSAAGAESQVPSSSGAGSVAPEPDAATELPDAGATGDAADGAIDGAPRVIVPSTTWSCGLPDGIPVPEQGELVLEADLELGAVLDLGQTQYGTRRVLPIDGGAFTGPQIRGEVMTGGLDWELTLPSGAIEVEARLILETDDGARIYLRVCGVAAGNGVRIVLDFEASSSGAYGWLNTGTLVGTREIGPAGMRLVVYRVDAEPSAGAPRTTTPEETDATLPRQTWDCGGPAPPANTSAQVFTAPVRIGSILSIGQSKYGSRTVIPITGGTFSGAELAGDVIPGGADFQLTPAGGSLEIEARYTLRTDDGVLISVRNCGGGGGTTPQFETLRDGPYAWLTEQRFSGTIGLAIGGVLISVYRAQ
jgi:hypothetical protein